MGLDNAGKTTFLNQIKSIFNTTSSSADPTLGSIGDAPVSSTAGNTVPTVGQNVATINLPDMYIKIWDVGGQLSLRRLWQSYYKSCHGVVFILDSTDLGSGELKDGQGKTGDGKWHGRKKSYFSMPMKESEEGEEKEIKSPGTPSTPWTPFTPTTLSAHQGQGRLEEAKMVLESVLENSEVAGVPVLVLANKQDREDCLEVVRIKEGFVRKVFEGEKGGMVRDSRVLPVSALKGTGVKEAVEWVKSRVVWNKEGRPPAMR